MVPIDVIVRVACLVLASNPLILTIVSMMERPSRRKSKAEKKNDHLTGEISRAYNKLVRPHTLKVGDLVLKEAGHVQKDLNASKFSNGKDRISFAKPLTVLIILCLDLI